MHLLPEHELPCDQFPYVLWPLKPLVYQLELLPPSDDREQTITACAATVRLLKRRCVADLGTHDLRLPKPAEEYATHFYAVLKGERVRRLDPGKFLYLVDYAVSRTRCG